jgi:hypothetical protein
MFKQSLGVLAVFVFVTLLFGCDVKFDYESIVNRAAIRVAKKKWKEQGVKDYTFVYQERCACSETDTAGVRVEVGDDHALHAVGAENGVPFPAEAITIDQLFDRVLEAAKDGVDDFSVVFDSQRKFIKRISLDPDENVDDDEYGFEIPCFSPEDTHCAFPLITAEECTEQEGEVTTLPTVHPAAVCEGGLSSARGQVERDVSVCCVN